MNKLIVDNNIDYNDIFIDKDTDLEVVFEDTDKELNFHIVSGICFKSFIRTKNTKNKINYYVDNNAEVVINKLAIDSCDDININLNGENSKLKYYTSIINYKDNSYTQKINHNCSDTYHYKNLNNLDNNLYI